MSECLWLIQIIKKKKCSTASTTLDAIARYNWLGHGPLTRYVKLRVAHAPRMPGTFSPSPWVSDPDMYHDTCVTHVPWCMPGSLTSGFLWSRWRGKRSRHSRRMHSPQFCVSGKRPVVRLGRNSSTQMFTIEMNLNLRSSFCACWLTVAMYFVSAWQTWKHF